MNVKNSKPSQKRVRSIKKRFWRNKRYLILPMDIFLAALSFHLAWTLRFDSFSPGDWAIAWRGLPAVDMYLKILGLLILTRAIIFVLMGLYRSIWSYASTHDLILILKTTLISSLAGVAVLFIYNRLEGIPRSILFLDGVLIFLLLCFRSFSWRLLRDLFYLRRVRSGKRTLLIGAGLAGNRLGGELRSNHTYNLLPVGYLDDDTAKFGALVQGMPVLGVIDELDQAISDQNIAEVIITTKLTGSLVRNIYRTCEERGVNCKTLPPLIETLSKPEIGKALRDISLEDLLGRDVVRLEVDDIYKTIKNKTVLISGAGGSIGSEVCRQVAAFEPAVMVLLDNAETPLYEIDYRLRNQKFETTRKPRMVSIVGDVRNRAQLDRIFKAHDVHMVFHCAAYKHVPMMELNPGEAVLNNVIGTCNLANAARDAGAERFVMISTDKAVNPVNIMGATKRIAELYIQNLARTTDTKYITVRFGNVLGSNGSVIPLFKKQIESGGPLTVTHPDIIRYFMTIQEAAGLVIQAGIMGQEGEIFILDMGEPVHIKDLAEDLIRFSGLVPHKDIEIRYIGLRPGEKLFEELLLSGEGIQPTRHKKIHIALSHNVNLNTLNNQIARLEKVSQSEERPVIDDLIASILPEYKPVHMLNYHNNPEDDRKDQDESASLESQEHERETKREN